MFRRYIAGTTFVWAIWAMIALSQGSSAQAVPGTVYGGTPESGNTILLGNGPTTPVLTYGAPAPTAGISNAGRAGISNSAPLPSNIPGQNDTVVYYSQPGMQPIATAPGVIVEGVPPGVTPENAPEATLPPENTTGNSAGESGGRAFNDLVPSTFVGVASSANSNAGTAPSADSVSLAQIALQYKTARASGASANARSLTNQDVQQMLSTKSGVTMAKNMPPLGPGAMPSGLTQSAASQNTATPSTAAPAGPPPSATAQQQTVTPPPADATQGQPAGAATAAGSTTTPQINPSQQSNDAQGKSRLPATATYLPLLGLLGAVSGGIGFLVRRFRR